MGLKKVDAPKEDEIEINLFGGGSGYGECLLLHLGKNNWVCIDSVNHPQTKTPLQLEYLNKIGLNPTCIQLIVATHWHDDHISGISKLFTQGTSAKLFISQALEKSQFLTLVQQSEYSGTLNSGINEFNNVFKHSIEQDRAIGRAIVDRQIFEEKLTSEITSKIFALSPSDSSIAQFENELNVLISKSFNPNLAIRKINPNHSSVVLLVEISEHKILLGADLETTSSSETGWNGVL